METVDAVNTARPSKPVGGGTRPPKRTRWRTAGRIVLKVLVVFGAVVAVAAVGITDAVDDVYPAKEADAPEPQAVSGAANLHDPAKPTAVIVVSSEGTNAADSLAPYEVLASTGAFNVYMVAETHESVPLTGGLDLVPDLTFDELDDLLGTSADAIVVPQLLNAGEPSSRPIEDWLHRQRDAGDPILVTVCVGTEVLASAGMLDGRPATSHWLGLIGLRRDYPSVDWQDGVRYIDDGDIITTAGVLSGIDGALRVVERLVGTDAAEQAAQAVRWPNYFPEEAAEIERSRPAPADLVALLSASYRFDRPDTGVLVTEGVGEIELASAFRPYTEFSYLARPVAVTIDGEPIESRHGLVFVPRADLNTAAPGLDRLIVPGVDAALAADDLDLPAGLDPVYLHGGDDFAFDGPLRDIAATYDVATARWVAKSLAYQVPDDLTGPAWPWAITLRPLLVALAAAAAVGLSVRLLRRGKTASTGGSLRGRASARFAAVRGRPVLRLLGRFLTMLAALTVGMFVLGPLEFRLLAPFGWANLATDPEIGALIMATNMTIGLTAWMLWRRHSRAAIAAMAAAMYASFAVFFPLLWVGALTAVDVMLLGHVAMPFAVAAVMLWRLEEFTGGRQRTAADEPDRLPMADAGSRS